jgi:hypothetical protein
MGAGLPSARTLTGARGAGMTPPMSGRRWRIWKICYGWPSISATPGTSGTHGSRRFVQIWR